LRSKAIASLLRVHYEPVGIIPALAFCPGAL
jgi:hypothetical protein